MGSRRRRRRELPPDVAPPRSDWVWAAAILATGAFALGGCLYAAQRAVDAIGDFSFDFDLGFDDDVTIGWDETDEPSVTTVPPQPAATCAALARVAWFTEASGAVWREHGAIDTPALRADLATGLPQLRDALYEAIAVSPPAVREPLAIALEHVNTGIERLAADSSAFGVSMDALSGARAIDDASDALGSGCGGLDLIGPFDSYFVFGRATTTTTTVAPR